MSTRRRMLMQAGGSPTPPPSVQFVEYLENTQTNASLASWLLTDFCPNRDDARAVVKFGRPISGDRMVIGTRPQNSNQNFSINAYTSQPYFFYIDTPVTSNYSYINENEVEIGHQIITNGNVIRTYSGTGTLVGNTALMAIFGYPNAPTPTSIIYPFVGPIYDVQCYYGNTLVRHYRPAREGTVGCAYETVTQQYVYNMGTTPFSFGPDIN